jgi:general secretion pathway protein F
MPPAALSLEDLVALNQEIAALARVGAPLETGLRRFAAETPGRLGEVAAQLSRRLSQGESLSDSAAALPGVPPVYAAIVEAGVRAGRLPAALEGLADAARRLMQLRRAAGLALVYPIMVLLVGYELLLFFLVKIAPTMASGLADTTSSVVPFFQGLSELGRMRGMWWLPPLVLLLIVWLWWWQTSRALMLQPRVGTRWLGWLPWLGRLQRYSELAAFTQTLALLIENQQPMPRAIVLAAQATGSRRLARMASQVQATIAQGGLPAADLRRGGLPPLVCWLLGGSAAQSNLAGTLQNLADDFHQRATLQAERIRFFLPLMLTVGIAGSAVALYALVLFWPWTIALKELAAP